MNERGRTLDHGADGSRAPGPGRRLVLPALVGVVIGGFCLAFVIVAITSRWSEVSDDIMDAVPGWLVVALVGATGAMVWIAWCWSRALLLTGHDASRSDRRRVLAWYFGGEIGKYVPGGVWTVVGRGELARRGGVATGTSYASVTLSLAALYLAGLVVAAVLAAASVFVGVHPSAALALLALLPVGLVVLHPRVLGRGRAIFVRLVGKGTSIALPPWRATLGLIARYVPAWLMIWAATWCVARALTPDPSAVQIGIATMLSWVAGIAAVPVPAGAGVREATFVALSGLPVGLGAAVAVTSRLLFIVVDVLGAVLATPWNVRRAGSAESNAPAS